MKMFCISDNTDTAVGLKFAGVDYIVLKDREEILAKIEEILKDKSIGILAVTNIIYEKVSDELKQIEEKRNIPLVVKIPSRVWKEETIQWIK